MTQINALLNQTVKPEEIWIWKNYGEGFDNQFDWPKFEKEAESMGIRTVSSNYNWKYCGRFALANLVDTEYTAIFDDDTIPGQDWFLNCMQTIKSHKGILGSVGVRLRGNYYQPHTRIGWSTQNPNVEQVDLVGHSWFYPSEYTKYMWMKKPMWENGEDMHFSAMAQIFGGIKTFVPAQPPSRPTFNGSTNGMKMGMDAVASSHVRNHNTFYAQRNRYVNELIESGWKLYKDK